MIVDIKIQLSVRNCHYFSMLKSISEDPQNFKEEICLTD